MIHRNNVKYRAKKYCIIIFLFKTSTIDVTSENSEFSGWKWFTQAASYQANAFSYV